MVISKCLSVCDCEATTTGEKLLLLHIWLTKPLHKKKKEAEIDRWGSCNCLLTIIHLKIDAAKLVVIEVFENGSTWFSFRCCCDSYHTVASWLCLQPWRHNMATAGHCHHHNSCTTTFRTQNITSTNSMKMLVRDRKKWKLEHWR